MPLCFLDMSAIWNHSRITNDEFVFVWEASTTALELSHEMGTWWQQPRLNIVDGMKKKCKRKIRFNDKIELYVGHAQELAMIAWPMALGSFHI